MRYSYEFKLKCIEAYQKGVCPEVPDGIKKENFQRMVRRWTRIAKNCGAEALRHKSENTVWSAEEKLEMVSKVVAGASCQETALSAGISAGLLYHWVQRYKIQGYEGLVARRRGRPPKEPVMKKVEKPSELTPSEREELIRLKAENEYLKAENEVIKKEMALRHAKWAAQLKAKKQRSSKSSEKKDIS